MMIRTVYYTTRFASVLCNYLQGEKQKFFSKYFSSHRDLYEIKNPRLHKLVSMGEVVE